MIPRSASGETGRLTTPVHTRQVYGLKARGAWPKPSVTRSRSCEGSIPRTRFTILFSIATMLEMRTVLG